MRVLLVQQTIEPPGGGNAVAAWMLQALHESHQVATFTASPWDPARVDRFFGTSLARASIQQFHAPAVSRWLQAAPHRFTRLRLALLFRAAQRHANDFDLLVTAENYGAFAKPGLQYVHYPVAMHPEPTRWPALVRVYYRWCDRLSRTSWDKVRRNVTLANSQWTAAALSSDYGLRARVLYPPVVDPGGGESWEARANTFLCIGRFHGSKRFEVVIEILARVHANFPTIRLHIVGSQVDAEYTRRLEKIAAPFRDWITIDEDLPQSRLLELMRTCRYGLHAMEHEHFGMAVAEMARAGCVVFVHDSGGQVEAIGGAAELRWRTADEAVSRIEHVLRDRERQRRLSEQLRTHAAGFSTERFIREFRAIVAAHPVVIDRNPGLRINSS